MNQLVFSLFHRRLCGETTGGAFLFFLGENYRLLVCIERSDTVTKTEDLPMNAISLAIDISTVGTGLVAGIFFAFSTFVMQALKRLAPAEGIRAMQAINVTVLNPLFFLAFFGSGVACLAAAVLPFFGFGTNQDIRISAAAIVYIVGTIGVTVLFNVPLNNKLAAVDPASTAGHAVWEIYLDRWLFWNHVRTIAAFSASVLFAMA